MSVLSHEDDGVKEDGGLVNSQATVNKLKGEAVKMCRVMKVLQEYISECDGDYALERKILPLHRYIIASTGITDSDHRLDVSVEFVVGPLNWGSYLLKAVYILGSCGSRCVLFKCGTL